MATPAQHIPVLPGRIAAAPSPVRRLAARLRTTPGRLEAATLTLFAASALFWGLTAPVFSNLHDAVKTVGHDTVPSIVAAEQIDTALADINASLANAILAKDDDTKPSWRTLKEDADAVAHALITAGENVTYGAEEETPLYAIQSNLPVYFRFVGQARPRLAGDPLPDVRAASELMQNTILPAAAALDDANFRHLTASYDGHRANRTNALVELLLGSGVLCALLIGVQLQLTRRTRRVINLPLLGATLLLAGFAVYAVYVFVTANEQLRAAKQNSFDSIHALWKARAVANDANAEESLYLLEHGTPQQQRHEDAFIQKSAQLLSGLPAAQAIAEATAGRTQRIKGLIGDELNNITYPGEREAASEMLRTFAGYLDIDRQIRDFERAGRHDQALALDIGTAPGESDWAFERFDKALGSTLAINQKYFEAQVERASSLLAAMPWAVPAVALLVALLAWLGLQPRINEYRF